MPLYTVNRQEKFFKALVLNGTVFHACIAAGISRRTHYRCMKRHPVYAKRFKDAMEDHKDMLICETLKRAIHGAEDPVYHEGKVVGYRRKFSDTLALAHLKARIPELFGDKQQIEIQGDGLAVVEIADWYGNEIHSDPEATTPPSGDST